MEIEHILLMSKSKEENLEENSPYYGMYKHDSEIFKNPDVKDLRYLAKTKSEIRFILDLKKKDVYIFDVSFLHSLAKTKLSLKEDGELYFMGRAEKKNNKWNVIESSSLNNPKTMRSVLSYDLSWIKKYHLEIDDSFKKLMIYYSKKEDR